MYRYVALLWNPRDRFAQATAERFEQAMASSQDLPIRIATPRGLTIFGERSAASVIRAYCLPNDSGAIIGVLFGPGDSATAVEHIDESSTNGFVRSRGRELRDRFWGAYIAFLRDSSNHRSYVLRDCSGKLPCYRMRYDGVDIVFADFADLSALKLPTPGINLRYVAAFIYSSQLQIRDCGLDGITEILAGDCFEPHSATQNALWHPGQICDTRPIDEFDEAVKSARAVTQQCVDAWASQYRRILHSLSGGLDSAVVLSCLRNSRNPPSVTCVNRYGKDRSEDERDFARLIATAANIDLMEYPFFAENREFNEEFFLFPRTLKPTVPGAFSALDIPFRNTISSHVKADSVWTGEGGDHLFMQTPVPLGARDYYVRHGIRPQLLRAIRDSARVSHKPYWKVLRSVFLESSGQALSPVAPLGHKVSPFLDPSLASCDTEGYSSHPWMYDVGNLPPGRQLQVQLLAEVLNRHRPFFGLESVHEQHPLLSQPLLELCLQIPSYIHLNNGIERAVERAAFRDSIPCEILSRQRKGRSIGSVLNTIHQSHNFICELLLDGTLVKERIVDRRVLERYLIEGHPLGIEAVFPFLSCVAAELWLQTWRVTALRAAA